MRAKRFMDICFLVIRESFWNFTGYYGDVYFVWLVDESLEVINCFRPNPSPALV